ncbi:MAG: glutathione S-transferase [Sinobacteraceae bacterium]|nr:glutathione S-transferase [Nevskiaceae bacterium]
MKLYYTPIKGYVHTVEAVIRYAGLESQIELIPTKPFDTGTPLAAINPLGKVPTLVLDTGEYLAGGPVIYEYLDSLHRRRRLFPAKGPQRWRTLRQAWMADGLFDTFVLLIIESWLPQTEQRPVYIARLVGKIMAILDQLERDVPGYDRLDIGQMRTVGALQFLRLKWVATSKALIGVDPAIDLFANRPQLAGWFVPMARKKMYRQPLLLVE